MSFLTESLAHVATAAAMLPTDSTMLAELSEEELLAIPELLNATRQRVDTFSANYAGEIARRSARDLGYQGLAQKTGFRTPEKFVQHLTGTTSREAAKLVRTGVIIREAELITEAERNGEVPPELTTPWLAPVGRAVAACTLSIEAAEAIRIGLGVPSDDIAADALADAATQLVEAASSLNPDALNADQLLIRAREIRDELDEAGIADRERALRAARSFRRYRRPDGMTAYSLLADPENAAYLDGIYDSLTSPRRGGPRMVDPAAKARDEAIEADPRTLEQLSFDGIMAVLRIGATTDEKTAARNVLGSRRPAVRVLITQNTLNTSTGHGRIEGQNTPVSIETVQRIVCESGLVPVMFDTNGQCIDLGREQRLYTARQRIGLAARDGGCRWPGCDRPASQTEAHHINQWARDHGKTNLADGILLCRYHHLLLHDNHWDIARTGGQYWLLPPASEDPNRTPRSMPHKSSALADLQREEHRRRTQVDREQTQHPQAQHLQARHPQARHPQTQRTG